MAIVKFYCDSGGDIQACREEELDTVEDLGLEEGEWEEADEDTRQEIVQDWADQRLDIYYEEVE